MFHFLERKNLIAEHTQDDATLVSLKRRPEQQGKTWDVRFAITPTWGWLASIGLALLVLLSLAGVHGNYSHVSLCLP